MKQGRWALQAGLLLMAMSAVAVVRNQTVQVKVLDSDTHSVVLDDSGVPKNCDVVNFDAYCHNSITTLVTHTLLVKVGDGPPFRVSCRADSIWSHCETLPKGATFDAKREKRGISVYVVEDKGKLHHQLYGYVEEKPKVVAARLTSAVVPDQPQRPLLEQRVKCNFTSTPPEADISIDGRYVGNTPSVLSLAIGDHTVEVSRSGFALWKRDLTLTAGSQVTVSAVLQELH